MKQRNLTEGNIAGNLICFALPMMAGNLLQQCYNIADTLIVGRFLGANALAAVGSSYSLMAIFVEKSEIEIISIGAGYLRIEGAFCFGIGLLFLLYGFYRAVKRPGMSVPVGWALADITGVIYYLKNRKKLLQGGFAG